MQFLLFKINMGRLFQIRYSSVITLEVINICITSFFFIYLSMSVCSCVALYLSNWSKIIENDIKTKLTITNAFPYIHRLDNSKWMGLSHGNDSELVVLRKWLVVQEMLLRNTYSHGKERKMTNATLSFFFPLLGVLSEPWQLNMLTY